jgi:hypothetical protein
MKESLCFGRKFQLAVWVLRACTRNKITAALDEAIYWCMPHGLGGMC